MSAVLELLGFCGEWFADDGTFDHAGADQAHRHVAANHFPIFQHPDSLEVHLEFAAGDPGGLASVTTQVLCLTPLGQAISGDWRIFAVQLDSLRQFETLVLFQSAHGNALDTSRSARDSDRSNASVQEA